MLTMLATFDHPVLDIGYKKVMDALFYIFGNIISSPWDDVTKIFGCKVRKELERK